MSGTPAAAVRTISVTSVELGFNSDLFDKKTTEIYGCTLERERAEIIGTSRTGLHRLRERPAVSYQRALAIAATIDVDVADLFPSIIKRVPRRTSRRRSTAAAVADAPRRRRAA